MKININYEENVHYIWTGNINLFVYFFGPHLSWTLIRWIFLSENVMDFTAIVYYTKTKILVILFFGWFHIMWLFLLDILRIKYGLLDSIKWYRSVMDILGLSLSSHLKKVCIKRKVLFMFCLVAKDTKVWQLYIIFYLI